MTRAEGLTSGGVVGGLEEEVDGSLGEANHVGTDLDAAISLPHTQRGDRRIHSQNCSGKIQLDTLSPTHAQSQNSELIDTRLCMCNNRSCQVGGNIPSLS